MTNEISCFDVDIADRELLSRFVKRLIGCVMIIPLSTPPRSVPHGREVRGSACPPTFGGSVPTGPPDDAAGLQREDCHTLASS